MGTTCFRSTAEVKGRGEKVIMSKLTSKERSKLPSKDFALSDHRYPIEDRTHARAALARVSEFGSPEEKAQVRAAVYKKYPDMKEGK